MFAVALTCFLGRPVLKIMERLLGPSYEGSLAQYHLPFIIVVLGGGFYAVLNLFYYVLVILRRQKIIFGIYVVLTAAAAALAPAMVVKRGIYGGACAYLILMAVMAAGFVAGGLWACRKGKENG